ncbi:hypothetical protein CTI12_AA622680 [Artemisia annua]|uniref:Uncharacterized protein n=1 Tax=Artemisia annua TaxID=35608 RepID=A0A2U1KBD7_ARTAN|nr:hypothetical protein CTI12_AA622680 [Artemisia annua]
MAVLKIASEVVRMMYMHLESWWQSFGVLFTLTVSWTYVTVIFLSSSLVFHLVCNLQIIHFDDYGNLLERETNVLVSTIAQVVGVILCLNAEAKISHRAQATLASRWHALVSCGPDDMSHMRFSHSNRDLEAANLRHELMLLRVYVLKIFESIRGDPLHKDFRRKLSECMVHI